MPLPDIAIPLQHLVDLIIVGTLAEAALLAGHHRRTASGIAMPDLAANLAAGIMLLVTLRLALAGSDPAWLLLALAGALVAHVLDLRRRWRQRGA